jgi:hypothetical protein
MVEEDVKQTKMKMEKALTQAPFAAPKLKKKQKKKLNTVPSFLPSPIPPHFNQLLTQIFGKSNALSSTLQNSQEEPSQDLHERALRSVQSIQRNRKVIETKKFAGQSIQ